MNGSDICIIGGKGQLGLELRKLYPEATWTDVETLDITDKLAVRDYEWTAFKVIINAAAYTNVDGAETPEGRELSWKVNALSLKYLTEAANDHDCTLVHISSDYVFDGTKTPHLEDEPFSPLNVYGASKAAGDIAASFAKKHYVIRTSWVVGEGKNFVRTMLSLGNQGINPAVVSDQIGRLTFTTELARGIAHLLNNAVPFGTYNVTNSGDVASWADIARLVFEISTMKVTVSDVSTSDYYKDKEGVAKRPLRSELSLDKIIATGFSPKDWKENLKDYINQEKQV